MSLSIVLRRDERLAQEEVRLLEREVLCQGSALLLVPSFGEALRAQEHIASSAGLGMGVEVSTPLAWARDRWDVWGDGRRVIDATARTMVMTSVVESAEGVQSSPGTINLLCDLASRALPWAKEGLEAAGAAITQAERAAVDLLFCYERKIFEAGFVEGSQVMSCLARTLSEQAVPVCPVTLFGFDQLSRAERELIVGLAACTSVRFVARVGDTAAHELARSTVRELLALAERQGVETCVCEPALVDEPQNRAPELRELLDALFEPMVSQVSATGAVSLVEPAGPLAEAELIAREVCALADSGATRVIVTGKDLRRAWRELAPKLVERSLSVSAQFSVGVLQTQAGRAFMEFARTVARLVELDASWPEPARGEEGDMVQLGDMSWWPPSGLVDFLRCDIAQLSLERADALDVAWRSNRLLCPSDVLATLLNAKATSEPVARATRELMRGRVGSAASKLLQPYVGALSEASGGPTSLAMTETTSALGAVLAAAGTVKEMGYTADPKVADAVSVARVVELVGLALSSAQVVLRPQVELPDARCEVLLATAGAAAREPACSADALVACGLSSQESPLGTGDDLLSGLLEALGIEGHADPLMAARASFARLCAVPRSRLLLERVRFSADAQETYPSVMLSELLSCYEKDALAVVGLGEDEARSHLSPDGKAPRKTGEERLRAQGQLDPQLRRLVTVPQEGRAELPDGLPVLSASQLESYLECPLKWFSLRRLRLGDNDAGFSPLEMGTFVHRVLELSHGQALQEALEAAGLEALPDDLSVRLPGSRAEALDEQSIEHLRSVVEANFNLHAEHQHMRAGKKPAYQALIPHSSQEEGQLDQLRRDLMSTVDYEATRFVGFEPRLFEWEFGRGKEVCTYAGVRVTGTVDRVDVNAHGQAVVIDYKHKGPAGFFAEYSAFGKDGIDPEVGFVLPRRIQALMYAQVIRRAYPDLEVVGALYMSTRGTHELSGVVSEDQADLVFGGGLTRARSSQVLVSRAQGFGVQGQRGMNALLDETERLIALKIEQLRQGDVSANPLDTESCSYCPVLNCERRLG